MSNKFNSSSLTEYSKSYARKLAGDFFATHSEISGQELLKLSPISQVNLFVIGSLSDKWKADSEKFRSSYFDFEHPEVRQALQAFMNTVSQHISLRREHLEPLLAEATKKTLILLFDPRDYFDEALRNQPDFSVSDEAIRQLVRYTKINRFIPATLENRMKGKEFIYVNQALNWLDEILTQRSRELENPEIYIQLFSEKVVLDPIVLLRKPSYDFHPPQTSPTTNKSFFETEIDTSLSSPPAAAATGETPVTVENQDPASTSSHNGSSIPLPENQANSQPTQTDTLEHYEPNTESTLNVPGEHFLSDSHSIEPPTPSLQPSQASLYRNTSERTVHLAEDLNKPEVDTLTPTTLGETFYHAPIESISKSISLNQKFMFINQLFNGNTTAYNQAIEELDRAINYNQARDLINYRYAAQFMWDMSSDEVAMLIDILKRRFVV